MTNLEGITVGGFFFIIKTKCDQSRSREAKLFFIFLSNAVFHSVMMCVKNNI